ncbi:hypothetical protein [Metamycoplasma alkalescens]|uniref:SGNH hydrolase-type esterase domain-containing protein n=3 Tax=Metamycoplasma alkalescens TaxID=45363 RepID=A0A318UBR3_9BACT|nr:hypothetical protein [Metamycoplasma alkalescens]PYF42532.1 hypothetical protein BCF88_1113 [Metamycoplasma alkalescens]
MKPNKKIKKISNLPMLIPLSLVIPLFSAACNNKASNKNIEDQINKNDHIQKSISGEIKYLAIGDDYAIGHNNTENAKNENLFDKEKNEVYGISYASYLANAILLLNDGQTTLNKYNNLGIANSKITDWLFLLNKNKYQNQKEAFEQTQQLNKDLGLINNDLKSEKLINAIEETNLLTISIGFNDIFKKHEILGLIFNQNQNTKERIESFKNKINQRIENLKNNYFALIDEIKQINPEINISLTGFLSPLLHTINLQSNEGLNEVFKNTTKQLNEAIQSVATKKNLNFYSFSNEEYLLNNKNDFTTDFISILPNKNAYKKLGQDIFAKMSINNSEYNKLFDNQENSKHLNTLEFEKKSTTIKSLIFGINNTKTDSYNKEYPFEKNQINKKIIASEKQNNSVEELLKELKLNLNVTSDKEIKDIVLNLLGILGVNKSDVYQTFSNLCDSLLEKNQINLLKAFFNQILESDNTKDTLKKVNIAILELLAKQAHTNTSFENIKNLIHHQWSQNNNFYFLIKDLLDKKYLEKEENKKFLETNLPSFIKAMFKDEILNKIFPNQLKNLLLNKVSIEKEFDVITKKISVILLNENKQKEYFKNSNFDNFVKNLFIDTKEEIIDLFAEAIKQIKKDKKIFTKTVKEITEELKNVYQIKNKEHIDAIEYLFQHLIESLDFNKDKKDDLSYQLLDLLAKTILNNLDNNQQINKKFFESLALDNKDGINKNNHVFFKLVSYTPNHIKNLDQEKYNKGMVYLGASLVKIDKFLDPKEINNLNKNKDSLFTFIKNLSEAETNELLNDQGKKNIQDFISLIIDDGLNNGLIKSMLNKLGNYLVVSPLINYIKSNNLETKILELNSEFNSIEQLISTWFKSIYETITNENVVNKIKKLFYNLIFDKENKYNKESPEKFILSILENIDQNGLADVVKELFNQLAKNDKNFTLLADIFVITINSKLKIKLDENDKKEISKDLKKVIENVPNSQLLKNFQDEIIKLIKSIDKKKINNFNDLSKELNAKLSNSFSEIINQKNLGQLFELLLVDNKNSKENNSQKINIIFKWTKQILEKIEKSNKKDIKELLNKLLFNSPIKNFIEKQLYSIQNLILKEDSSATEFAKKTVEKIKKIIFDKNNDNVINSILDWILEIKQTELKEIDNWNGLFKKILASNSEKISSLIKPIISELIDNKDYLKQLIAFSLKTIGKKYQFDSTDNEIENIANFVARTMYNLNKNSDLISSISNFLKQLIDNISKNEIKIEEIKNNIFSALKQVKYEEIFTEEFFKKASLAAFDKNVNKEELKNQLNSIYSYFSRNISKLKTKRRKRDTNQENKELIERFKKIFKNLIKGFNGSLNKNEHQEIKESITNTVTQIINTQIEDAIKNIDSKIVANDKLKKLINSIIKNNYFKDLINEIISEFFVGEKIVADDIGNIIHTILEKVSNKLNESIVKTIKKFTSDKNLMNELVEHLINLLNLEHTTSEDKKFLSELLEKIINHLIETEYFKTKVVKRTTNHIVEHSKEFDISNPLEWLFKAFNKIKSGFGNGDLNILGDLIGDEKPINGESLVKLINLIFGKSNFENSILYRMLRNVNMNSISSERTNIKTLNDQTKISNIFNRGNNSNQDSSDPDNITPSIDVLKLADSIFKMLYEQYKQVESKPFKDKIQTEQWKAVYRLKVVIDFILFEMFGRETLVKDRDAAKGIEFSTLSLYTGVRSILWEIQEGTNLKAIPFISSKFTGMQAYFKKESDRRQFTNYAISESGWFIKKWTYFDEKNYGPESITYIITSSGYNEKEKDKLTQINFQTNEKDTKKRISKKEYILLTLKEGGYGKFMKLNNKKSISTWSGLDKINENEYS